MRNVAVSAILAAAVGCAGGPTREEVEKIRSDMTKLQVEMTTAKEYQSKLYEEMVAQTGNVSKDVAKSQALLADLQARMDRLEDQVRSLAASCSSPAPKTVQGPTLQESAAGQAMKTVEQIILETETAVAAVRAGKLKPEEAAHQLKPHAKHAAPRIIDEIRRSLTQIEYTILLEAILSKLPPEELKTPLQKALGDKAVRLSAARVVGAAGDRELSKILEEAAAGDDEDMRLMAGESLVRCRNAAGIPALVMCLRSEQRDTRTIAINALRSINRGEDFGYRAALPPMENAAAIKQWDEWVEKFGRAVFEP